MPECIVCLEDPPTINGCVEPFITGAATEQAFANRPATGVLWQRRLLQCRRCRFWVCWQCLLEWNFRAGNRELRRIGPFIGVTSHLGEFLCPHCRIWLNMRYWRYLRPRLLLHRYTVERWLEGQARTRSRSPEVD